MKVSRSVISSFQDVSYHLDFLNVLVARKAFLKVRRSCNKTSEEEIQKIQ